MQRISVLLTILVGIVLIGCETEEVVAGSMQEYVSTFGEDFEIHGVIACAANNTSTPTLFDVFFYPVPGASNFKYFETSSQAVDEWDYNLYKEFVLERKEVFNGYLNKFIHEIPTTENWGIVTFEKEGKLFISDPIINKPVSSTTEVNVDLITITENGLTPSFSWEDGNQKNNDIYFQVISDATGNLISGTYTREKSFTFYNTSNVVLDINQGRIPVLESGATYTFTLMAVDDDNWVNLLAQKEFSTN